MTRKKMPAIKVLHISSRGYHTIRVGTRKRRCRPIGGLRPKYFGTDFVIKFNDISEDSEFQQTTAELDRMKDIDYYDRKYFPKIFGYDRNVGYLVQEKISFKKDAEILWKERLRAEKIVSRLAKKYNLQDVGVAQYACGEDWNWAIRKDGRPVIYDFAL